MRKGTILISAILLFCVLGAVFLLYGGSGKSDSLVGTWNGDSTYTDTTFRYWGEKKKRLDGVKREINKYHWEFYSDSTCFLDCSRSGKIRGKYHVENDSLFIFRDNQPIPTTKLSILSFSDSTFRVKFMLPLSYIVGQDPDTAIWILQFKRNESDTTSSSAVNPPKPQTDERIAMAQADFEQHVAKSQGTIKLESFTKTNGYDQEIMGMKIYVLEWEATLSVEETIYKSGDGIMGYWHNFYVMKSAGEQNSFFPGKRFDAGTKVTLNGTYMFQKKENGWEAGNYEIKRQRW